MGKSAMLFYGSAIALLGVIVVFVLSNMSAAAIIAALIVALIVACRIGLWRSMLSVSFVAAVMHASLAAKILPDGVWYAAQFAPLAVSMFALLARPKQALRSVDRRILWLFTAYCAVALLTALTGMVPQATLAQSGILVFVASFLQLTYARRWIGPDNHLRGDIATVFWLIVGAQAVGIGALAVGQVWATADYGRFQGVFSNANFVGIASMLGLMVGVYLFTTRKIHGSGLLYVAGGAVLAAALLFSGSRGALLAIAAGFLALVLVRSSRRILLPLGLLAAPFVLIAVVFAPETIAGLGDFFDRTLQNSDVSSGRFGIYAALMERWQASPVFGSGYRTTEVLSGISGIAAHNIYLSTLVETGVVGLAVFAAMLLAVLSAGRRAGKGRVLLGAFAAILVGELVESTLFGFGGPTALLSWLVMLAYAASGHSTAEPEAVQELPPATIRQALSR